MSIYEIAPNLAACLPCSEKIWEDFPEDTRSDVFAMAEHAIVGILDHRYGAENDTMHEAMELFVGNKFGSNSCKALASFLKAQSVVLRHERRAQ